MKVLKVDHNNDYVLTINIIEFNGDDMNVVDSICENGSITRENLIEMCRNLAMINNCTQIFINDEEIALTEIA